jgi:hypothetical protein
MDAISGPSPRAIDEPQVPFEDSGDVSGSMEQSSILDVTDATIGQATTGGASFSCSVSGRAGALWAEGLQREQPAWAESRGEDIITWHHLGLCYWYSRLGQGDVKGRCKKKGSLPGLCLRASVLD